MATPINEASKLGKTALVLVLTIRGYSDGTVRIAENETDLPPKGFFEEDNK